MRSIGSCRDHSIANDNLGHELANFQHGSGALIANNVRDGRERSPESIEGVATFNADGFNLYQHLVGATGWISDVLVAKDLRSAIAVVHRCLHLPHPSFAITRPPEVTLATEQVSRDF